MELLNADQLKIISTICSKLHISKDDKATMVNGFSAGRCISSKELYFNEAIALVSHLQDLQGTQIKSPGIIRMIGKICGYAREMGWSKKNPEGKVVADMNRLNEWAIKYGYLHKKINAYHYDEFPILVTQFEKVYKTYLNKL